MESTLAEVEDVGWKKPIRSGAAETNRSNTRGNGSGAKPQGGKLWQLNTDRAMRAFPITGALPEDYKSRTISVKVLAAPGNLPPSASKVITQVGLLDDKSGNKRYFYAFAKPSAIALVNNTSEGHQDHGCLQLENRNLRWITLRDVENATVDYTVVQDPEQHRIIKTDAQRAGIAVLRALVGWPKVQHALKTRRIDGERVRDFAVALQAQLGEVEDPNYNVPFTKAREQAFKNLRLNGYVDVHNPELSALALRAYAASRIVENKRERKYSRMFEQAAETMRQEGGIEIGTYDGADGRTIFGIKLFDRDAIRGPIRKYIRQAAVAAAYGAGKPFVKETYLSKPLMMTGDRVAGTMLVPTQETLEYIEQLIAEEETRLFIIRDESRNNAHNGVISFNDLATKDISDTPPMDDAAIAPAIFYSGAQALQHYLNQQNDARSQVKHLNAMDLQDLQSLVKRLPKYADVWKRGYMKALDNTFTADEKERSRRGDTMLASDETVDKVVDSWLNLITAYSNNRYAVNEANARNTLLDGWTIATRKSAEGRDRGQINYALIPPLHTGGSSVALVRRLQDEGFTDFEQGGEMRLVDLLRPLYVGAREQRAKIITRPTGSIALTDALDAADNYATNRDSNMVRDLKSKYDFDERLLVKGMTTEELLQHNARDILKDTTTSTGKEYLNTAETITNAFKHVFMRISGKESVARTLMEIGQIHLPDLHRTVLFGPGGELYEIKGKDPVTKRTILEAVPVRLFAQDSLYYKTLERLQHVATGTAKEGQAVTLLGAFQMVPGDKRANDYLAWANPLIQTIKEQQTKNISSGLQGLTLYANMSDILQHGFKRTQKGDVAVTDTGAATAMGIRDYKIAPDEPGARSGAQESYNAFVKHLRTLYAERAVAEDKILHNPDFQDAGLKSAVRKTFANQSRAELDTLQGLAVLWRNIEDGLGSMLGRDRDMKAAVVGQLELERQRDPHLRNSMLTKLTDLAVKALSNLYARFVTGLASTFNLFNPVNIVNSARSALLDTIVDAFGYAFSMFVTNFVNKHFKESITGKKVATSVLDSLQIRVMRPTEMRLLGRLRGSSIEAHATEFTAVKVAKIRSMFQNVQPGYYNLPYDERDNATHVYSLPELGMRPRDKGEYNDPEFEVQYYVKNPDAFTAVSGGLSLDQIAGSRDMLNKWWRSFGYKALFPTRMEVYNPTLGRNVNVIDSSMINAARMADDPSRFVHVDGSTIRIGMKTTAFGIEPREVFGDKRELARKRKAFASAQDTDERTENKEFRRREEEARKRARAGRGTPSDMLSGALNLDGSTRAEDITGANPQAWNTDTGEHDPADVFKHRGKPSDRF